MKILALICRILLGLMFTVFGANGIHQFMPAQMPPTGNPLGDWVAIMHACGWMTFIAFFQFIGGLLILAGRTVPLGLCILCPITVNILAFHIFFHATALGAFAPGLLATLFELILLYAYRANFAGILTANATPTA